MVELQQQEETLHLLARAGPVEQVLGGVSKNVGLQEDGSLQHQHVAKKMTVSAAKLSPSLLLLLVESSLLLSRSCMTSVMLIST